MEEVGLSTVVLNQKEMSIIKSLIAAAMIAAAEQNERKMAEELFELIDNFI